LALDVKSLIRATAISKVRGDSAMRRFQLKEINAMLKSTKDFAHPLFDFDSNQYTKHKEYRSDL
jgi:hypothetical protein